MPGEGLYYNDMQRMSAVAESPVAVGASPEEVMRASLACLERGCRVVMATVLRRKGSTPSTPGQKLALMGDGGAVGSVGGGAVEHKVLAAMSEAMAGGRRKHLGEPWTESYELGASLGMCCGGAVEVLFEVLDPALEVLIVGAGHIGSALAPLLATIGFRVVACDHREAIVAAEPIAAGDPRSSNKVRLLHAEHDDPDVSDALGSERSASLALVMTHDHQLDQRVIEWALREGFGFVGGVGSRAKAARMRTRLEAKGFSAGDIARVEMPLGSDIGARSPAEIAVSIAGSIIRWRAAMLGTARLRTSSNVRAAAQ